MFSTISSGLPGMCFWMWRAMARPYQSYAPPEENLTSRRMVSPGRNQRGAESRNLLVGPARPIRCSYGLLWADRRSKRPLQRDLYGQASTALNTLVYR